VEARKHGSTYSSVSVSEVSEQMPEWYWYLNAGLRSNARKSLLLLVFLVLLHVLMESFPRHFEYVNAILDFA
jgi:hypothetical protein